MGRKQAMRELNLVSIHSRFFKAGEQILGRVFRVRKGVSIHSRFFKAGEPWSCCAWSNLKSVSIHSRFFKAGELTPPG